MFDGLQILLNTTKHDQTHTNTIKQHQTRCSNGKMFGQQTIIDGVWSPNIYRLSRPLGPVKTRNIWRPNTIKHCLMTKQADVEVRGQTVKTCLIKHRSNN